MRWVSASSISSEDRAYPVTQVYCWLMSSDNRIAIVSKDGNKWQLPGGHPSDGENLEETLVREVWEETGVDIKNSLKSTKMFGYYVVQALDDSGLIIDTFLQTRFFLQLKSNSGEMRLNSHEKTEDTTAIIKYHAWVTVDELVEKISWMPDTEEYKDVLKMCE